MAEDLQIGMSYEATPLHNGVEFDLQKGDKNLKSVELVRAEREAMQYAEESKPKSVAELPVEVQVCNEFREVGLSIRGARDEATAA